MTDQSHSDPTIEHGFERTVCACENCTACCKRQPGPLANGDFERIAQAQGWAPEVALEQAQRHFVASPGAVVKDSITGQVQRVGTITPKRVKGRCIFLTKENRCSIHAVAPFGCAYFDTHMSYAKAHPRSLWLVYSTSHKGYQALRAQLPYTQSYNPRSY